MFCCRPARYYAFAGVVVAVGGGLVASDRLHTLFALPIVSFVLCVAWGTASPVLLRHNVRDHQRNGS